VASSFGVKDELRLIEMTKHKYPRNSGLAMPGSVCGTCLKKDFGMISEIMPQMDLLLGAYKVNEFLPKYLVDLAKDKIYNKNVGILGVAFKKDSDDTRDTQVDKLARYIQRQVPASISASDHNLCAYGGCFTIFGNKESWVNNDPYLLLKTCDIIFIGTNHSLYSTAPFTAAIKEFIKRGGILIDIWGIHDGASIVQENK
jgi:UDP-N-acetyl-D-mannosaminuronic acid dehydrogenase